MKTRVIAIPQSRERDLPKGIASHKLIRVIRASCVRSLALLGMTPKNLKGRGVGGKISVTE
jgi:hypothetical protein